MEFIIYIRINVSKICSINAPFLITYAGVIFGLKSTYNTPLSSKLEFLKIIIGSFLSTLLVYTL